MQRYAEIMRKTFIYFINVSHFSNFYYTFVPLVHILLHFYEKLFY